MCKNLSLLISLACLYGVDCQFYRLPESLEICQNSKSCFKKCWFKVGALKKSHPIPHSCGISIVFIWSQLDKGKVEQRTMA